MTELKQQLAEITRERFALDPEACGDRQLYQALLALTRRLAEERTDVIFGGRLGSYRYYDMDKTIGEALKMVKQESDRE